MSKYTLIIKKDARKYRTPLFETNNNTIRLEMQQKEVKICGGVGRGLGDVCCTEKSLRLVGAFAMTNAQQSTSLETPTPPPQVFWGVTGDRFKFIASF